MCYINILYIRMSVCMKYVVQKQASITGRKRFSVHSKWPLNNTHLTAIFQNNPGKPVPSEIEN